MGGYEHNSHRGKRVALVALGPTSAGYVEYAQRLGGRFSIYDEVWSCNTFIGILEADLYFHMDDMAVQEIRAEGGNERVAQLVESVRRTKTPIITSRAYERYPTTVEFPLEEVLRYYGPPAYFNNTMAYALAYAGFAGVESLHCYGLDYYWGNNPAKIESGKACCEFWLGRIRERPGVSLGVVPMSTLMNGGKNLFYGYDHLGTRSVVLDLDETGAVKVGYEEKEPPTAEAIEDLYNHSKFDNLKHTGGPNCGIANKVQELADAQDAQVAG